MPEPMPRDELNDLERRLAALRPSGLGLDRDRMLFEAGRAAARAEGRAWRLAAAASMLVAAGLGLGLARERSRAVGLERELTVAREVPRPRAIASTPLERPRPVEVAPNSYLALSRRAFAGLDDLPPATTEPRADRMPRAPERILSPLRSRGPDGLRDL